MRHEFRLADIGEGLEEAEIINWLVAVGDHVTRDQPLIEVMTDKSNAELPAPAAGTIVELGGAVGDLITVGQLIAVIAETGTSDSPEAAPVSDLRRPETTTPRTTAPRAGAAAVTADESAPAATRTRIKASPATRRQAADRGINLASVTGTGPAGRILLADLEAAAVTSGSQQAPTRSPSPAVVPVPAILPSVPAVQPVSAVAPAPPAMLLPKPTSTPRASSQAAVPPTGVVPLRGVRRAVAKNMTRSWSEIPHIHTFAHIDAAPLMDLRARLRATGRAEYQQLTPLAFFVAALGKALTIHPDGNASLNMADETISYNRHVNVGVAVASPHGLVVPVMQAVDLLDFPTLCVALNELVRGARDGNLAAEHFRGGTVTITNFGALGGEQATPLIRPPESMILGFGSIAERPFVIDGQVVARRTMHTVAGADHRLIDGDTATAVLTMVNEFLADPLQLVL